MMLCTSAYVHKSFINLGLKCSYEMERIHQTQKPTEKALEKWTS
jgi:hypothetical protein